MDVVENLRTERVKLAERLVELDQIQAERTSVIAQVAQIDKAIAVLTKPAGAPGTRKEMSPEAKERIRAGLAKARAAKLAGNTGGAATKPVAAQQPAPAGPNPETVTSAKKPAIAEKGEGRGK